MELWKANKFIETFNYHNQTTEICSLKMPGGLMRTEVWLWEWYLWWRMNYNLTWKRLAFQVAMMQVIIKWLTSIGLVLISSKWTKESKPQTQTETILQRLWRTSSLDWIMTKYQIVDWLKRCLCNLNGFLVFLYILYGESVKPAWEKSAVLC